MKKRKLSLPSPNFIPNQKYLHPAGEGINAEWAHDNEYKGTGVYFVDIEKAWFEDNNDPAAFSLIPHLNLPHWDDFDFIGTQRRDWDSIYHGTAVLGILFGKSSVTNDVSGIASGVMDSPNHVKLVSDYYERTLTTIADPATVKDYGDVSAILGDRITTNMILNDFVNFNQTPEYNDKFVNFQQKFLAEVNFMLPNNDPNLNYLLVATPRWGSGSLTSTIGNDIWKVGNDVHLNTTGPTPTLSHYDLRDKLQNLHPDSGSPYSVQPGTVILIERALDELPVETDPEIRNEIKNLVDRDVIVIEPIGNDRRNITADWPKDADDNLEEPYGILVGASEYDDVSRTHSRWIGATKGSNFIPTHIDCFALGAGVFTTVPDSGILLDSQGQPAYPGNMIPHTDLAGIEYGDFTGGFGGTSSASAIIAGAALVLQSRYHQMFFEYDAAGVPQYMNQSLMRTMLTNPNTSTQTIADQHIGVMPDLQKILQPIHVVLVLDVSGSMRSTGFFSKDPTIPNNHTKLDAAIEAATCFTALLQSTEDLGYTPAHKVGLVTFNSLAQDVVPIDDLTTAHRADLDTEIRALNAGGSTSIGEGVNAAQNQLVGLADSVFNPPSILLMTDGKQNTGLEYTETNLVNALNLSKTRINIVGFGSTASIDTPSLTSYAEDHFGRYAHAASLMSLTEEFVKMFGNIFDMVPVSDPEFIIKSNENSVTPMSVDICDETNLIVVLGWETFDLGLELSLQSPDGNTIDATTSGVKTSSGRSWTMLKFPLPINEQQSGKWNITVNRTISSPKNDENFFISVLGSGKFKLMINKSSKKIYTGDELVPEITLRGSNGTTFPVTSTVSVKLPNSSVGTILTKCGLDKPISIENDVLDPRSSTVFNLEKKQGKPLISYRDFECPLDAKKPNMFGKVFGQTIEKMTTVDGNIKFLTRLSFENGCKYNREISWSAHIEVGIDPSHTKLENKLLKKLTNGKKQFHSTFLPCDKYGNFLGPGMIDSLSISIPKNKEGTPLGILGELTDNNDGTYSQDITWDDNSKPHLILTQTDRDPIILKPRENWHKWICVGAVIGIVAAVSAYLITLL